MAFKFKDASIINRLDGDYGCGVPSRYLSEADLEYIKREYSKDTADICECIFKGEIPSGIKMDCECGAERDWQISESLQGGHFEYDKKGNISIMADIALEVFCGDCGCDSVKIDSISVINEAYVESKYFHI